MIRMMVLIPLAAVLLACGLVSRSDDRPTPAVVATAPSPEEHSPAPDPVVAPLHIETPVVPPSVVYTVTVSGPTTTGDFVESPYAGDSSIEEKIIESTEIVRATLNSVTSEVMLIHDWYGVVGHRVVLKFNLSVSEYLKGSGPTSIVAVWTDGESYETSGEANDRRAVVDAQRDTQWDAREAIIFLYGGPFEDSPPFKEIKELVQQRADHLNLGGGSPYTLDDHYSLHSESDRIWLPAVSGTDPGGDQEFLLDVPPTTKTITLGGLKTRIAEVTAEYSGGDGSEVYRNCVLEKYRFMRNQRNWPDERGSTYGVWTLNHSIPSGQPAGTVLEQTEGYGDYPYTTITTQLAGADSTLFTTGTGVLTSIDKNGDGVFDQIKYDQMVGLARPLPAGEYTFEHREVWPGFAICNFAISNEWTVTVTAPTGVLHELLFDPVTVGSSIAADDTNGVLKPAYFTVGDGSSATIERISYEPPSSDSGQAGTVKLAITAGSEPDDLLGERLLDFIELDGTVSLSLYVAAATVDTANDTLSWTVSSQPWDDGDKLMVRIRSR